MVLHTDTHSNESRQLTHNDVSNGLPHTPNVLLSCADVRHCGVNLRPRQSSCLNILASNGTLEDGNTKSKRSHGGQSCGGIPTASQVLLRATGARITVRTPSHYCHRNGNRGWRLGIGQDTGKDSRIISSPSSNGAENSEATFAAQQAQVITNTNSEGVNHGSRSKVQLCALAARVHDKLSGFLGHHAGPRFERSAYARTGACADAGADLQSISIGRSATHSQEAVIALLATVSVWAAYVAFLP
jgi:hypothetical protein